MKFDPLQTAYLKVINENASSGAVDATKKQVGKPFGHSENDKNTHNFYADSGPEAADGEIKDPEEAPSELTTAGSESTPKKADDSTKDLTIKGDKLNKESNNPFDVLFKKIISEDTFDFSTETDNTLTPDSDFGGPEGIGRSSEDEDEEEDDDYFSDDESEEEEEHESLEELISKIKELVTKLEDKLHEHEGHEDEEHEGHEDEEESDEDHEDHEDEEEEVSEEAVEADVLGHALVDQEKLEAGLTKKASSYIKTATPVKSNGKKAEVVKGKKVTGKPEDFKNDSGISKLQAKDNNVGAVQTGKYLFDQN